MDERSLEYRMRVLLYNGTYMNDRISNEVTRRTLIELAQNKKSFDDDNKLTRR